MYLISSYKLARGHFCVVQASEMSVCDQIGVARWTLRVGRGVIPFNSIQTYLFELKNHCIISKNNIWLSTSMVFRDLFKSISPSTHTHPFRLVAGVVLVLCSTVSSYSVLCYYNFGKPPTWTSTVKLPSMKQECSTKTAHRYRVKPILFSVFLLYSTSLLCRKIWKYHWNADVGVHGCVRAWVRVHGPVYACVTVELATESWTGNDGICLLSCQTTIK